MQSDISIYSESWFFIFYALVIAGVTGFEANFAAHSKICLSYSASHH